MTLSKPGHNLSKEDSAKVSSHEAIPTVKDGPEGYSEDGPIVETEDDRIEASYANSTAAQSEGKAKNDRKYEDGTGSPEVDSRIIVDSPTMKARCVTLRPSRFGTPFACEPYQHKHDFFKGLLPDSTRLLFDQVVAEASTLKELLLTNLAPTNNRRKGLFCALNERDLLNVDFDSSQRSDRGESKLQLYVFEPTRENLRLQLAHLIDRFKPGERIDVRSTPGSKTGEVQYYVVNNSSSILYINDILVEPTERAGPLPEFAVFVVADYPFFWWHTAAALDYMPQSVKRKRRSDDSDGEVSRKSFKGDSGSPEYNDGEESGKALRDDTNSSPNWQVFPDSKNWLEEYRRRLKVCEKRPIKYTSLITNLHPPHHFPAGEMHDIDVILAIGAVWLGLIEAKVDFAYANSDLFSFARSMRMVGMHAVKGTSPFLMPLLFHDELQALSAEPGEDTVEPLKPAFSAFQRGEAEKHQEDFAAAEQAKQKDPGNKNRPPPSLEDQEVQNKTHMGGIGHFMLAVAEKVNSEDSSPIEDVVAESSLVRLRFMDSAPGFVNEGRIRRVARNTVRNAGWLGDIWPRFDVSEEYLVDVLRQSGNRCGEHTVLNAWAYMLGIPLATTRERKIGYANYNKVRRMIGLALRGQLDSLTIRAWMQHSKYAVDESLSQLQQTQMEHPNLPNNLRNMHTVALNEDAFNEIVNEIYIQGQAASQGHATKWGATSVTSDGATPVATAGCSNPQLEHAAEVTTRSTSPLSNSSQSLDTDASNNFGISPNPTVPARDNSPTRVSYPPPRSWKECLINRRASRRALKVSYSRTSPGALKTPSSIPSYSNLADYDVVLGIAPIWEGLKRLNRADVDFTYAGMDVFAPGGDQQIVGAVGGWRRFIMPLFFSDNDPEALETPDRGGEKSPRVGHLLLCVAELVNDKPMTVQFEILDSSPGTIPIGDIIDEAKRIVEHSGWLDTDGPKPRIVYKPFSRVPVPCQVGIHTCGLHVILNAWAYMLGITPNPDLHRRGQKADDDFLQSGLEIVNLALAGFMDSETIQAFFNVHGYSAEQRFGDPARAVVKVNAIGMNQVKLFLTLQRRKADDTIAAAHAKDDQFKQADIDQLMGQDMSEDQAWRALVMGGGNVDRAMGWHFDLDPFGVLPRPEDALSPKTPETLDPSGISSRKSSSRKPSSRESPSRRPS